MVYKRKEISIRFKINYSNYKTELKVSWRDTTELDSDVVELLEILGEIENAQPFNTIYKDVL